MLDPQLFTNRNYFSITNELMNVKSVNDQETIKCGGLFPKKRKLNIQLLKEEGVSILSGDFKDIWTEEPLKCRYCVPILSKSYIQQNFVAELNFLLVRIYFLSERYYNYNHKIWAGDNYGPRKFNPLPLPALCTKR